MNTVKQNRFPKYQVTQGLKFEFKLNNEAGCRRIIDFILSKSHSEADLIKEGKNVQDFLRRYKDFINRFSTADLSSVDLSSQYLLTKYGDNFKECVVTRLSEILDKRSKLVSELLKFPRHSRSKLLLLVNSILNKVESICETHASIMEVLNDIFEHGKGILLEQQRTKFIEDKETLYQIYNLLRDKKELLTASFNLHALSKRTHVEARKKLNEIVQKKTSSITAIIESDIKNNPEKVIIALIHLLKDVCDSSKYKDKNGNTCCDKFKLIEKMSSSTFEDFVNTLKKMYYCERDVLKIKLPADKAAKIENEIQAEVIKERLLSLHIIKGKKDTIQSKLNVFLRDNDLGPVVQQLVDELVVQLPTYINDKIFSNYRKKENLKEYFATRILVQLIKKILKNKNLKLSENEKTSLKLISNNIAEYAGDLFKKIFLKNTRGFPKKLSEAIEGGFIDVKNYFANKLGKCITIEKSILSEKHIISHAAFFVDLENTGEYYKHLLILPKKNKGNFLRFVTENSKRYTLSEDKKPYANIYIMNTFSIKSLKKFIASHHPKYIEAFKKEEEFVNIAKKLLKCAFDKGNESCALFITNKREKSKENKPVVPVLNTKNKAGILKYIECIGTFNDLVKVLTGLYHIERYTIEREKLKNYLKQLNTQNDEQDNTVVDNYVFFGSVFTKRWQYKTASNRYANIYPKLFTKQSELRFNPEFTLYLKDSRGHNSLLLKQVHKDSRRNKKYSIEAVFTYTKNPKALNINPLFKFEQSLEEKIKTYNEAIIRSLSNDRINVISVDTGSNVYATIGLFGLNADTNNVEPASNFIEQLPIFCLNSKTNYRNLSKATQSELELVKINNVFLPLLTAKIVTNKIILNADITTYLKYRFLDLKKQIIDSLEFNEADGQKLDNIKRKFENININVDKKIDLSETGLKIPMEAFNPLGVEEAVCLTRNIIREIIKEVLDDTFIIDRVSRDNKVVKLSYVNYLEDLLINHQDKYNKEFLMQQLYEEARRYKRSLTANIVGVLTYIMREFNISNTFIVLENLTEESKQDHFGTSHEINKRGITFELDRHLFNKLKQLEVVPPITNRVFEIRKTPGKSLLIGKLALVNPGESSKTCPKCGGTNERKIIAGQKGICKKCNTDLLKDQISGFRFKDDDEVASYNLVKRFGELLNSMR